MLRFLKYFCWLLLVVFIADRTIYFLINKVQNATFRGIQGGKINHYLSLEQPPTMLIMGPSNAAYQINPANFKVSTYNLGHPDTEDAFQMALLSIITGKQKLPKNILLHINPYAYLGKHTNDVYASKSPLKLGYYYSKDEVVTKYINNIGIKERVKYFFKLSRYNNKVVGIAKDFAQTKISGVYNNGFFAFDPSSKDSFNVISEYRKVLENAKPQFDSTDVIQTEKLKYLEEFVARCKQHNINLILFTLPYYPDVMKQRADDMATRMVRNFSTLHQLQYFDFRQTNLSLIINKPFYWKDMQHLNALGSKLESEYVSQVITPFLVN